MTGRPRHYVTDVLQLPYKLDQGAKDEISNALACNYSILNLMFLGSELLKYYSLRLFFFFDLCVTDSLVLLPLLMGSSSELESGF